jgi:hypothetical protein
VHADAIRAGRDVVNQTTIIYGSPPGNTSQSAAAPQRHPVLSEGPPAKPFSGVPPRIVGFAGRGDELNRLNAILMQSRSAAVTQVVDRAAVQGLGGVGKTSLAVEYAHRFRGNFAGVWLIFDSANTQVIDLA